MAHGLMGLFRRTGLDAPKLRADSLRNVVRLTEEDPALRRLLIVALERYFRLTERQEEQFLRLVARPDYVDVREVLSVTEERWMLRGEQELLLRLMRRKFGNLPAEIVSIVRSLASPEAIEPYADRVLTASRLEERGFPTNGSSFAASH